MPVIKSAKKKLRQDKKRQIANKKIKELLKKALKEAGKNATEKTVKEAFSIVDKAAKKHILHKNKAGHIKSALSKKLSVKTPKITEVKTKTSKPKKTASKKTSK